MPLEGHWARQQAPLRPRERRLVLALPAALAACVVVVAVVAGGGGASSPGCVDATIASTTGGAAVHACGDRARRLCAAPAQGREIQAACRRAGY